MSENKQHDAAVQDRIGELRARLLTQTTGVIRRRRYYRRAGIIVACAGCYLAGLLTVTFVSGGAPSKAVSEVAVQETVTPDVAVRDDGAAQDKSVPEQTADQTTPRRAPPVMMPKPQEKKSRFLSLRELGDRYLLVDEDPAGAARCYQMALRYATEEEVNQHPDEGTWLFRALKLDYKWETDDARNQG